MDPKLKDPEERVKRFKMLDFENILDDLNMERVEYVNALRVMVKGKYTVFHERKASNLHINQYNPGLLLLNGSNMDFTWISGKLMNIPCQNIYSYPFYRCICNNCIHLRILNKGKNNYFMQLTNLFPRTPLI